MTSSSWMTSQCWWVQSLLSSGSWIPFLHLGGSLCSLGAPVPSPWLSSREAGCWQDDPLAMPPLKADAVDGFPGFPVCWSSSCCLPGDTPQSSGLGGGGWVWGRG